MHVSPAKHSYACLPRKRDYRTDTQTDRRTDKHRTKWSLCVLCFEGALNEITLIWFSLHFFFKIWTFHMIMRIVLWILPLYLILLLILFQGRAWRDGSSGTNGKNWWTWFQRTRWITRWTWTSWITGKVWNKCEHCERVFIALLVTHETDTISAQLCLFVA